MHEFSLVRSLLRQVRQIAHEQGVGCVKSVSLAVGPLSGVEPELLRIAFDQLTDTFDLAEAELSILENELTATCRDCNAEFVVERFLFQCDQCQSRRVTVTGGDEVRILDLVVVDRDPLTANPMVKE